MTGVLIKTDLSDISNAAQRLNGLTKPKSPLMQQIARVLRETTRERFETQKDPTGKVWQKGHKKSGLTLMGKSQNLRDSIEAKSDETSATVGTNRIYGGIHQTGGVIKAKRAKFLRFKINGQWVMRKSITMPARPFLGISEADKEAINHIINDHLNGALNA